MDKKYIFLDLDGTIIDHKSNSVPLSTKKAIKKLQDNGHEVIISTGRPVSLLYGIDKELNVNTYIASNGRIVFNKGIMIHNDYINKEVVKELVKVAYDNKIDIAFESDTDYVINSTFNESYKDFSDVFHLEYPKLSKNYHLNHDIYQMVFFYVKSDYKKYEEMFPTLNFHYANEYGIDINEKGGMKEIGMKILVEAMNIDNEDIIAVGDGFNDISMIEYAHLGVAMGNSCDELKETADMVTDSVDNDGIYKLFKKLNMI